MKKSILLGAVLCVCITGFSQQDPQFSQNMHNRLFPNPGVAGSNKAICATLLGRQQWMGFDGKPETYLFTIHAPVRILRGGLGLSVTSDKLGSENTMGLKAAYAYRQTIGVGDLGIGVGIGMVSKSIKDEWVSIDPYSQDPSIPDNGASDAGFDLDFGLYYKTNKLYVGLSSTHLTESDLEQIENNTSGLSYKVARHYYIMAGYEYEINPSFTLLPSVFVKSDASSTQFDVNINVLYNNLIWGGVSYRFQDAIVPMIGIVKEGIGPGTLKFGYSYDVTTSALRQYSSGSHEIMLGYCFKIPEVEKVQKHKTVRFL